VLELKYLYYLCQTSLTVSGVLSELFFKSKLQGNMEDKSETGYKDEELEDFLVTMLQYKEHNSTSDIKQIELSLPQYPRLTDLIQYMHHIYYYRDKQRPLLKESFYPISSLADYQLKDSSLAGVQFDNEHHICKIYLNNVISHKAISFPYSIESKSIELIFEHTDEIKINEPLLTSCSKVNVVYDWHLQRLSNGILSFCMLILIGYKRFLIQITCTKISTRDQN
jgi:hypothetical protein